MGLNHQTLEFADMPGFHVYMMRILEANLQRSHTDLTISDGQRGGSNMIKPKMAFNLVWNVLYIIEQNHAQSCTVSKWDHFEPFLS